MLSDGLLASALKLFEKTDNILYKLDGQDRILNELLHKKETAKVLQNQPSIKQP